MFAKDDLSISFYREELSKWLNMDMMWLWAELVPQYLKSKVPPGFVLDPKFTEAEIKTRYCIDDDLSFCEGLAKACGKYAGEECLATKCELPKMDAFECGGNGEDSNTLEIIVAKQNTAESELGDACLILLDNSGLDDSSDDIKAGELFYEFLGKNFPKEKLAEPDPLPRPAFRICAMEANRLGSYYTPSGKDENGNMIEGGISIKLERDIKDSKWDFGYDCIFHEFFHNIYDVANVKDICMIKDFENTIIKDVNELISEENSIAKKTTEKRLYKLNL